jgi:hypothetical protein
VAAAAAARAASPPVITASYGICTAHRPAIYAREQLERGGVEQRCRANAHGSRTSTSPMELNAYPPGVPYGLLEHCIFSEQSDLSHSHRLTVLVWFWKNIIGPCLD